MSNVMRAGVVLVLLVGVVVVMNHRSSEAQIAPSGTLSAAALATSVGDIEGNYRVYWQLFYMDKTSDKSKMEQVKRIEFHPEYVVLVDQNEAGRLIPVHSIKQITWERT